MAVDGLNRFWPPFQSGERKWKWETISGRRRAAKRKGETMKLRLDKYLAEMGIGTRSEVKKGIRKRLAQVNGQIVCQPEYKVDTEEDRVSYAGVVVSYVRMEYYMLYKPSGIISASEDAREPCVVDLIQSRQRRDLFPVGRLDRDTEGLLLITNDGALAHRLLAPNRHVDKVYYARIRGRVTQEDVELFHRGVEIGEEKPTLPAELSILRAGEESEILLTIREGKFHQVKRMFRAVGKEVLYLKRLRMGTLSLDDTLKPGEYRALKKSELDLLC